MGKEYDYPEIEGVGDRVIINLLAQIRPFHIISFGNQNIQLSGKNLSVIDAIYY
ncbi:hypothetical protein XBKB1_1240045 [Xenorhabdus bovienii str. kraussei Becker Underwood]|uniref:Uncharacterized protein n=1 Tax=Xenorhabdus bovienii str. kraussei Becker Underwood TaxID=1398204 RepID=A0A077PNG7_XENBV|nr:hypothetical protein XBKB1_1240045 [Xenorhabdus bovienii str. kraussei Becker Underwood]